MTRSLEDLQAYQKSVEWALVAHELLADLHDECPASVRERLAEAALTVPTGIASGYGVPDAVEKRRCYGTARAAVYECRSLVHVMARLGMLRDDDASQIHENLADLSKLTGDLVRTVIVR